VNRWAVDTHLLVGAREGTQQVANRQFSSECNEAGVQADAGCSLDLGLPETGVGGRSTCQTVELQTM